jgi:phosphoglycerate dehydrogenase-like enzyme
MTIVLYPAVDAHRFARLQQAAGGATLVNAQDEPEALRAMSRAEGFVGKLTPELLAGAPLLRWVQAPTASLEHYLFPQLVEHPCVLTNVRGLYSDVVADHALLLLLALARNLSTYVRQQQLGLWRPVGDAALAPDFARGPGVSSGADLAHLHVAETTLGIVGLGEIGREIARRGRVCGMRVVAVDPRDHLVPPEVARVWPPAELGQLLAESDFVVIAAPHTPQTERWFRRPQFQAMKRSARLINVGRGAIVVLEDLVAALEAGEIAGAALDVFEREPLPAEHPLWRMEQVLVTPHVAACSPRIAGRHLALLADNLDRFVRGAPLRNIVDKRLWY